MSTKEELCKELFDIGAVKFGLFTLKSGLKSPIYLDLRILVSYPETLKKVGKEIAELCKDLEFDKIAGIPYAAIAMATAVSLETGWSMIYTRKEIKDYGTKKAIEGVFKEGEKVLVIDDLITNGGSKLEVIEPLKAQGLIVKDFVVLVDREQGGKEELAKHGYGLHAAIKITEMLEILKTSGKISEEQYNDLKSYFDDSEKWQKGK